MRGLLALLLLSGCSVLGSEEAQLDDSLVAGGGEVIDSQTLHAVGWLSSLAGECTGTAVGGHWVLTAAHCFDDLNDGSNWVPAEVADAWWSNADYLSGVHYNVENIVIHDLYRKDDHYQRYDVALVWLDSWIADSIPVSGETMPDNAWFASAGFGVTGAGAGDFGSKRYFYNQVDEVDAHHYQYNKSTTAGQMPVGCSGDSGGPMLDWTFDDPYGDVQYTVKGVYNRRSGYSWEGCVDSDHYFSRLDLPEVQGWLAFLISLDAPPSDPPPPDPPAPTTSSPTGVLDGVSADGAWGWACDPDAPLASIEVHVYIGGAAGSGAPGFATTANIASEAGVAAACGGGDAHRFTVNVPGGMAQYQGQPVYAYGIDTNGDPSALLAGSGVAY